MEAAKHGAKLVISARSEDQLRAVKQRCLGNLKQIQVDFVTASTQYCYKLRWVSCYRDSFS